MGYSDQKYFSQNLDKWGAGIAFGTATASGTNTLATPSGVYMPNFEFPGNTAILGIELVAATAPNNKQGGLFQILNGTNTIITATYTSTATVGSVIYGSYTGTYTTTGTATADVRGAVPKNVIGSGTSFTLQLVLNTATASSDTTGTWDFYLQNVQHV
jgi:hypothetical protein